MITTDAGRPAAIRIPPRLARAVVEDDIPTRRDWLAALPSLVTEIATRWELALGDPYLPGGQCAWVAPTRDTAGDELVLKVAWRHPEAEGEAAGLRHWAGEGCVRCYAARDYDTTTALLLERCTPGRQLKQSAPEPEQDEVIARLLARLWARAPAQGHPFTTLEQMCHRWADSFARATAEANDGLDPGLARAAIDVFRDLPRSATTEVLLCADLHAENVLAARREPWLVIDPKPLIGDPAFDPVQHILNCEARLRADPIALARRMAGLLDLDPHRVHLWLFARCAQESVHHLPTCELARRLAP
ncbi:MAG: hypothetical protein J2O49_02100 [Sciscionella sp.]|nr:hypothetical protein [Sciscionella sp.]